MNGFLNSDMRISYGHPGQVYNVSSLTGCNLLSKHSIAVIADQELIDASRWILNGLGSKWLRSLKVFRFKRNQSQTLHFKKSIPS
jgi:hypothetical protein